MTFDRQARAALVAASVTLLICGIGFRIAVREAHAVLAKEPVKLRRQLTSIPKQLGAWRSSGEDRMLTAELEEALGTRKYLDRVYVRDTERGRDQSVMVHMTYYTGIIDAVPHVPDRCMTAGGWVIVDLPHNLPLPLNRSVWVPDQDRTNRATGRPYPMVTFNHHVTGEPVTVRMPIGEFKLRTTEFRLNDRPNERIFAGYFFVANGRTTPWPEGVRTFAFDLTSRHAYFAKIQFTMIAGPGSTSDDFIRIVATLADEILPELMLCLPDWAEIEEM